MATQTCPACASEVKEADLICFTCGANLPRTAVADVLVFACRPATGCRCPCT